MGSGFEKRKEYMHFHRYWFDGDEEQEVLEALRSGWITRGPKTAEFESEFTSYLNHGGRVLGTNSCTASLHLALLASGIGAGDEVIVPPLTFAATANVCEHVGARPVFADVRTRDLTLDPDAVARALTPATRAVIPVHYAGFQADVPAIAECVKGKQIVIIEDAAHSVEGEIRKQRAGAFSDFAAFSFYATKNISSGEGGALWSRDQAMHDRAAILSLHGMSRDAWRRYEGGANPHYDIAMPGFKYNMFDLQAALLLAQLRKLDHFQERREELAARYLSALQGDERIRLLQPGDQTRCAWHLFPVILDPVKTGLDREQIIAAMHERNVGCSLHFIPLHIMSYYRDKYSLQPADYPVAAEAFRGLVSLPLFPRMKNEDVDYVCTALRDVLNQKGTK